MRVDIDRLDNLMNLAGELVVNRARFVQLSRQLSPALQKISVINRMRDFGDALRRTIDALQALGERNGELAAHVQELQSGLRIVEEQSELWDHSRRCFSQISEAIDQLTRVSDSLQRGVLGTRMVPVAPLFNRFRRVVRDLAMESNKKVNLQIRGEKTELDKRMIDELGDPLIHLIRNSIDHGLEPPDLRRQRGKPEVGTILLEASHSGNNVYIHVRDDGRGIDLERIRQRLVDNHVQTTAELAELTDGQVIDYIWHPGFSTAREITDVSGRGVGMDVVKTRIEDLNGTIHLDSSPGEGTTFSLRLPLTLAILNSLLVRIHGVVFSIPIDDVREIVSLYPCDMVTVRGKQTFDVRGEFMPLVSLDNVFRWNRQDPCNSDSLASEGAPASEDWVAVIVLQAMGKTLGLRVDELMGSQDIVIKSLAENFRDIRGLSGASILGDGTVCLMLDAGQLIEMATSAPQSDNRTARRSATRGPE
jgi:two-component system chemotaxis sensor kinase CheA